VNDCCVFCKVPFKDMNLMSLDTGKKIEVKVLHCLHSACGLCLQDTLKTGLEVACPCCDSRAEGQNYNKYLCNFAVNQSLDYRAVEASRDRPEEKFISCDECIEGLSAVWYCTDCVRRLCQECGEHHSRSKSSALHSMTVLKEICPSQEKKFHRTALCPLHPDQQLEFFCEACNCMCCRECIHENHETHPYKLPSGGIVDRQRQALQEHIQHLLALGAQLQERHQKLTLTIEQFSREQDASAQNIKQLEAEVKHALEERKQVMLAEVEDFMSRQRDAYEVQRASLATTMLTRWRAIDFLEKVLTRGTNCEVLLLTGYISAQQLLGEDVLANKVAELAVGALHIENPSPLQWRGDMEAATKTISKMAGVGHPLIGLDTDAADAMIGQEGGITADSTSAPSEDMKSEDTGAADAADVAEEKLHAKEEETQAKQQEQESCEEEKKAKEERRQTKQSQAPTLYKKSKKSSAPRTISLEEAVPKAPSRGGATMISIAEALDTDQPKVPAVIQPSQKAAPSIIRIGGVSSHSRSDEELAKHGLGGLRAVLGTEGEELGSFRSPCGMAVDSRYIYIADTLNHRIQVFDKFTLQVLGQVVMSETSAVTNLDDPSGMCCTEIDGNTTLMVVEYGLDRILRIELAPDCLTAVNVTILCSKILYGPFGVGISMGRLVVADSCNHRCLVLTTHGQLIFEFGSRGIEDGQFEYPECVVTFGDGSIGVSDKDNHRIQVFDPWGSFKHFIPSDWSPSTVRRSGKTIPGSLSGPMGMCVDQRDRVYVADCGSNRIQIFSASGKWLWSSDVKQSEGYTFKSPTAMAADDQGLVFVASDHCVQVF